MGASNLISGNVLSGVLIDGAGSQSNRIQGNLIGTDITGTSRIANGNHGIGLQNEASNNTIGGTTAGARKVISGNRSDGVSLDIAGKKGNVVVGNFIGVDVTGAHAIINGGNGVEINFGAGGNLIGGRASGAGNVISGNSRDGVQISDSSSNVVQGNKIGTDATGMIAIGNAALPNARDGIEVISAKNNVIGSSGQSANTNAANVISGNSRYGVEIVVTSSENVFEENLIGTNAAGTSDLVNTPGGISFSSAATQNTVVNTLLASVDPGITGSSPSNTLQNNKHVN